jgi:hypothetical protein
MTPCKLNTLEKVVAAGNSAKTCCWHRCIFCKRIYAIWHHAIQRCHRPECATFKYYGNRGIQVCDEWHNSFNEFRHWALENGYHPNLELDRRDGNGHYCPNNCRWATHCEQQANTRSRGGTSQFKGVYWSKARSLWIAQIKQNGKARNLGGFISEDEAALVYDFEARIAFGTFAALTSRVTERLDACNSNFVSKMQINDGTCRECT